MLIRFWVTVRRGGTKTESLDVEWPQVLPLPVVGDYVKVGPYELVIDTREFFVDAPTQPWVEYHGPRISHPRSTPKRTPEE